MPKKINLKLKPSPEVMIMMDGFIPRFGNATDIDIVKTYGEIMHLRTLADSDKIRREQMDKITKTNGARARQIETKEKRLLWLFKSIPSSSI